jgi:hypothetical protein
LDDDNKDGLTHNEIDTSSGATTTVNGNSPVVVNNGYSTLNGSLQIETNHRNHEQQLPPFINGVAIASQTTTTHTTTVQEDVPLPTENGGYTHTTASRAKISAANKGKTPWNKGKARSEETRALIAAGVRAKNRERFLQKLMDLGVTEEEYERDKKEERRTKDAERRARKTLKGGYRPTNETKQKISTILKGKWARGEMRRGSVNPDKVRRGFTHSAETRAKISASLKQLWAKDADYRDNMMKKSHASNSNANVKQRISASLKQKWQDPEFRALMLERIQTSRKSNGPHDLSHRERISQAMKKKWQDDEYRQKTLGAIEKRRSQMAASSSASSAPPKQKKVVKKKPKKEQDSVIRIVQPVQAGVVQSVVVLPKKNLVKKRKKKVRNEDDATVVVVVAKKKEKQVKQEPDDDTTMDSNDEPEDTTPAVKQEPKIGSIQRLREERRDLYDLLYGEEVSGATALGDENLDTFDPYGLDDF